MSTIREQLIRGLEARGWQIVPGASRKYTLLQKVAEPFMGKPRLHCVWVGRNGAARYNHEKRIDGSIPLSDRSRAALLAGHRDNENAKSI